jgi:hypothetical protein
MRAVSPIVFLAPGAGLGHLVRSTALALELRTRGVESTIVTSSPYAAGMARLTGVDTVELPLRHWADNVRDCVVPRHPHILVQDVFPFGFRGEWLPGLPVRRSRMAYLARRMRVEAYLEAIGDRWRAQSVPGRVLVTEPLSGEHTRLLRDSGVEIRQTRGRIRLPWSRFRVPLPHALACLLATGRVRLVVHSGPRSEIQCLVERAQRDRTEPDEPLAVISPLPSPVDCCPCFDYFPASALYARARHVYTGAGYNSLAERAITPDTHTAVAFERRYDDQAGRLAGELTVEDGTGEAADALVEWMGRE